MGRGGETHSPDANNPISTPTPYNFPCCPESHPNRSHPPLPRSTPLAPDANKPISNFTDCYADGGLRYKPRMGDAVLFWSVLPDGVTLDPHALHGSCPVVKGDKWVAVKWIRNKGGFNP